MAQSRQSAIGSFSSRRNWGPPPPHPQASVPPPPWTKEGQHSLPGERAGEPIRTTGEKARNFVYSVAPSIEHERKVFVLALTRVVGFYRVSVRLWWAQSTFVTLCHRQTSQTNPATSNFNQLKLTHGHTDKFGNFLRWQAFALVFYFSMAPKTSLEGWHGSYKFVQLWRGNWTNIDAHKRAWVTPDE